jgi:hypothetical protein
MLLCLDFASKKAKLIGVEKEGGKFKVVVSLEFGIAELAEAFGEFLKSSSADIHEIRVSGALENSFHQVFTVPDLKTKMLRQALETEVIKAFGNNYQFQQEELGELIGPGNQINRRLMTVGLKVETLEKLSGMFADSRIKPSLYTTYPMALQALVREMEILSEKPLAFVEIDYPTSRVVIFKGREIRLTRELPVAKEEKDPDRSALAMDIYRTLLFYSDTFPDEQVSRLVFAGNSASKEAVENLRRKTGAEIIPFLPGAFFQGMEEIPYVHPGCLGLALLKPQQFSFGYVPRSVQQKRKIKKTLMLSTSISAGVLLILALVISRLALNLQHLSVYQSGVEGEIKMKEETLKDLALEFISQSIETSQPSWPEVFQEVAAAVPPGVALEALTLKKANRVWRGEASGVADGTDEITSLLLAEEVQSKFAHSPLFTGAKMTEKEVRGQRVEFKLTYQLQR